MTVMSALVKTASKVAVNFLLELSREGVKVERRDQLGARGGRGASRMECSPTAATTSASTGGSSEGQGWERMARCPRPPSLPSGGKVSRVRDDPDARLALMCRLYAGPAGDATTHLPYRRASVAFMRWQLRRGPLRPLHGARSGSPWWRAVNERWCAMDRKRSPWPTVMARLALRMTTLPPPPRT
jgi:hypothetical protein